MSTIAPASSAVQVPRLASTAATSPSPLVISMLSTYPPTACGLATFSAALTHALTSQGHDVRIVRVDDEDREAHDSRQLAGRLVSGSVESTLRAAFVMSDADAAIIQHEFGIYGGRDGEEVLDILRLITVPVITILHTVPVDPTPNQRRILEEIGRRSSRVVVLTKCASDRLLGRYAVDAAVVETIPHGAIVADNLKANRIRTLAPRPQLLSWGLLGPNKGIERVIDAVATLNNHGHRVRYTITGMTHPKILKVQGEAYRNSLVARARSLGVGHLVRFDRSYRGPQHLAYYLSTSSVIVLPYGSTDQAVSGVLVDSIAAGRPVIATPFPHAVELLSDGAGILVGHDDRSGLVDAIRAATSDQELLSSMTSAARALAPMHEWSAVGASYAGLVAALSVSRPSMSA